MVASLHLVLGAVEQGSTSGYIFTSSISGGLGAKEIALPRKMTKDIWEGRGLEPPQNICPLKQEKAKGKKTRG